MKRITVEVSMWSDESGAEFTLRDLADASDKSGSELCEFVNTLGMVGEPIVPKGVDDSAEGYWEYTADKYAWVEFGGGSAISIGLDDPLHY